VILLNYAIGHLLPSSTFLDILLIRERLRSCQSGAFANQEADGALPPLPFNNGPEGLRRGLLSGMPGEIR
jgi:hypothetical protein